MPEGVVPGYHGHTVLNDQGEVAVDIVEEWPSHVQAGTWFPREGSPRPLGVLGGRNPCFSHAINQHGWIVGTISEQHASGWTPMFRRAFLWTPATGVVDLPYVPEGGSRGFISPRDINDRGEVVGCAARAHGLNRAFRWDMGSGMWDLGVLSEGGESYAVAINDDGWTAGHASDASDAVQAVLWKPGSGMLALGEFRGAAKYHARDINDRGEVLVILEMTRSASGARVTKPVLWTEEGGYEEIPLPAVPDEEWSGGSINDLGQILLSGKDHYFLVSGGEMKELPRARKGTRTRYSALNNHGWLAGWVELDEPGKPTSVRGFIAKPR